MIDNTATLPQEIRQYFSGDSLVEKVGFAFYIISTDEDLTPRVCMVDAGEVLAVNNSRLRFILWKGTNTCRNLAQRSRAMFTYSLKDSLFYLTGSCMRLSLPEGIRDFEAFEMIVNEVRTDAHSGFEMTRGLEYSVVHDDSETVAATWVTQLNALRLAVST